MRTYTVSGKDVVVSIVSELVPPFEDAVFYESGESYAKVVGPRGTFYVDVQGEKCLMHDDGRDLRTADDYRSEFPDGVLPEDESSGWAEFSNSWWAVVSPGDLVGNDDEVCDSFASALETAIEFAGGA